MAIFTSGDISIFMNEWRADFLATGGDPVVQTSSEFKYNAGESDVDQGPVFDFKGSGLTYHVNPQGITQLSGGTITSFSTSDANSHLIYSISGLNISVANFMAAATSGTANFEATILAGDDTITGSAHDDVLYGFGGNDTINGGAGFNLIDGGDGNDQLNGGGNVDHLTGDAGNDTLHGGGDNDVLDGGTGTNNLFGDAGDDTFIGGTGSSAYNGGDGTDVVDYSAYGAAVTIDLRKTAPQNIGNGHLESYTGIEHIVGSAYNDTFTGSAGDDYFDSGFGSDTFHLEAGGNDTAITRAEEGNSTFYLGASWNSGDTIIGSFQNSKIILNGDYSAGLTVTGQMAVQVQVIKLIGGHSYKLSNVGSQVDATNLGAADSAIINGAGVFRDGAGNDVVTAGSGGGQFFFENGGNDTLTGSAAIDTIYMGGAYTIADHIDGGASIDTIYLNGDYSTNHAFDVANIEKLVVLPGHSYNLTLAADFAQANFKVLANRLAASDTLTLDASAITVSHGVGVTGGPGADHLTGSNANDQFDLSNGGNDVAIGGGGDDVFTFNGAYDANDSIDGGTGNDAIWITTLPASTFTLDAASGNIHNVENLHLEGAQDYHLAVDANYADTISVQADNNRGHAFSFDGHAFAGRETVYSQGNSTITVGDGGSLVRLFGGTSTVTGGAGKDHIEDTGPSSDTISGGGGADTISLSGHGNDIVDGGSGSDSFTSQGGFDRITTGSGSDRINLASSNASGTGYITVTDFAAGHDKFAFTHGFDNPDVTKVTAIDATVTHGQLDSGANMNAELIAALGSAQLGGNHAVVFRPDSGTLAGHAFLVISSSSTAGYHSGDFVVELAGTSSLALTVSNFEFFG